MLILMNSAMMPMQGYYSCKQITAREYKQEFEKHKTFKSYIGYNNTALILYHLTGKKIELCWDSTDLKVGDTVLVSRLKYRVPSNEKVGRKHGDKLEDYEFFLVRYYDEPKDLYEDWELEPSQD